METPIYDIRAFAWDKKTRSFSQDAWNLEWMDDDHHMSAFPNMKDPFYIENYYSGEKRLFTYLDKKNDEWIFENEEENIMCYIGIAPF